MSKLVNFFFNFGSTYSYLSVMRLEDEAAKAGGNSLAALQRPKVVRRTNKHSISEGEGSKGGLYVAGH